MDVKQATLAHSGTRRVTKYNIWGVGEVWIQSMTEQERQFIDSKWISATGKVDENKRQQHLAWYIRTTVVTDESAKEFAFEDGDVPALSQLDSKVADAYRSAINEHCTMPKKNWQATQDDSGGTG